MATDDADERTQYRQRILAVHNNVVDCLKRLGLWDISDDDLRTESLTLTAAHSTLVRELRHAQQAGSLLEPQLGKRETLARPQRSFFDTVLRNDSEPPRVGAVNAPHTTQHHEVPQLPEALNTARAAPRDKAGQTEPKGYWLGTRDSNNEDKPVPALLQKLDQTLEQQDALVLPEAPEPSATPDAEQINPPASRRKKRKRGDRDGAYRGRTAGGRAKKRTQSPSSEEGGDEEEEEVEEEPMDEEKRTIVNEMSNFRLIFPRWRMLLEAHNRQNATHQSRSNAPSNAEPESSLQTVVGYAVKIRAAESRTLVGQWKIAYLEVQLHREMERIRPPDLQRNLGPQLDVVAARCGWTRRKLQDHLRNGRRIDALICGHAGLISLLPFQKREGCSITVKTDIYRASEDDITALQGQFTGDEVASRLCCLGNRFNELLDGNAEAPCTEMREVTSDDLDFDQMSQQELLDLINKFAPVQCDCETQPAE